MSTAERLAQIPGLYVGLGEGVESGSFLGRVQITRLANGGASIDYEAISREHGLQHREHSVLAIGPGGRDRLYVAYSESPYVVELIENQADSGRFEQATPAGPYRLAVVLDLSVAGQLTYAWWWGTQVEAPIERSRVEVHAV
jgi:hypothetical protein